VFIVHNTNTCRERRGKAPFLLNLNTRCRCEVSIMPLLLYPRKEPWYPMYRRLDGSQRWYEHFREEKNLLSMFVFNPGLSCTWPSHYTNSAISDIFWNTLFHKQVGKCKHIMTALVPFILVVYYLNNQRITQKVWWAGNVSFLSTAVLPNIFLPR